MENIIPNEDDKLSYEQKYIYLEQVRDYIYKDVVLADTKAGFALTIVTVSLAVCVVIFGQIKDLPTPWNDYALYLWVVGLSASFLAVLFSMLTILPRSYISHEIANNPDHWIHKDDSFAGAMRRRLLDALNVIRENIWQRQSKGTPQSLKLLIESQSNKDMTNSLYESMQRALLVQNFKFLWVGKALLFAFLSFFSIGSSALLSFGLIEKQVQKPVITHTCNCVYQLQDTQKEPKVKNKIPDRIKEKESDPSS